MDAAIVGPTLVFGALAVLLAIISVGLHVYDKTPTWYRLAFYACCTIAALCVWFGIIGYDFGIVTKDTATFWGGLVAAVVTLTSFLLGRFADEMTKAQAAAEARAKTDKEHVEARVSLAYALYAEISSNVEQQRRTLTKDIIDLKISRMGMPAKPRMDGPAGQSTEETGYKTASAPADSSQPFYKIATEKYDLIPSDAIMAIVKHYNIDAMANIMHGSISAPAFDALKLDQKYQMMAAYYETLLDYDRSGVEAANELARFIRDHSGRAWNELKPRDDDFLAYAADRIDWLRAETLAKLANALHDVPVFRGDNDDRGIRPASGPPPA